MSTGTAGGPVIQCQRRAYARRMRRLRLHLAGLAGAALLALAPSGAAAAPVFGDAAGLHVVSAQQLSPRLFSVRVSTSALPQPVDVRVLLPDGYDAQPAHRYPVLYLFHGTSGRAADWTTQGDAVAATAGRPLIVVMPDAGFDGDGGGYFADAWNGGARGLPQWERFHVEQVIPWVDAELRTVAARAGRAIYGLSQGGYGAIADAARHPDLFAAAGSFSGPLDIAADPAGTALMTAIVTATETGLDGDAPGTIFGSRLTQELNWRGHDPATLAANLRGIDLRLYTGDGRGGPLDPPGTAVNPIEAGAHELTQLFHDRLEALQIPSTYRDYGPGTHTWPYWARDLRDSIGPLMDVFAHPQPDPARFDFRSSEDRFAVFGWDVRMVRPAREFAALRDAGAGGFSLAGSGAAQVLTPPVYGAGRRVLVAMSALHADTSAVATADGTGRLHLDVPLGPGNPAQQYTAAALLAGTRTFTTRVRLTPQPAAAACHGRAIHVDLSGRHGAAPLTRLRVTVDGRRAGRASHRGGRVRVVLPALSAGPHRVRVQARRGTAVVRASRTVSCG